MSTAPGAGPSPATAHIRQKRWREGEIWLLSALVLVAIALFYTIVFTAYWPFRKEAFIDLLQKRSRRSVSVDSFRSTYFPPGCVAEGVKFWLYTQKEQAPLITIQKIEISVTYPSLLTFRHRLDTVTVTGLHLIEPAHRPPEEPTPLLLLTSSTSESSLPIRHLHVHNAVLDFYHGSGFRPLRITFYKLSAENVSANSAVTYNAELSDSEVPGLIRSTGSFGPWNSKQQSAIPARGSFTYQHGDLSPIQVVSGSLDSKANFNGQLGHLNVNGWALVHDLDVSQSSHSRDMALQYNLAINAITGEIAVRKISAAFNHSEVLFSGSISTVHPTNGRLVSIDLSSQHARVEDLLDLFNSNNPALTGDIKFTAHVGLAPVEHSFVEDMSLNGSFEIAKAAFTNPLTEAGLTKLSQTSRTGKREDLADRTSAILSDLKAQTTVTRGVAHFSQVDFRVPGAKAVLSGSYSLLTYEADLHGRLITSGNISNTRNGLKSLFIKVITPFFKRYEHARIIPFKITGPYGHTTVSLDLQQKPK
jgi:hypothetical protein